MFIRPQVNKCRTISKQKQKKLKQNSAFIESSCMLSYRKKLSIADAGVLEFRSLPRSPLTK